MTDTLILAAILIPCLIIAIVFHEVAHGFVAWKLGDPTAKQLNRLSLNPIRHIDPVGTLLVPGALALAGGPIFGWAKPVPVMQNRLDNPRYGMMAVAAAGPGTNFLLAVVGAIAFGIAMPYLDGTAAEPGFVAQGLFYFILINVFLGIFNLLPLPPFDGSHIVEGLLPRSVVHHYAQLRRYGMLLFLGLIALMWIFPELGIFENTIMPPVNWAMDKYLGLAAAIAG